MLFELLPIFSILMFWSSLENITSLRSAGKRLVASHVWFQLGVDKLKHCDVACGSASLDSSRVEDQMSTVHKELEDGNTAIMLRWALDNHCDALSHLKNNAGKIS